MCAGDNITQFIKFTNYANRQKYKLNGWAKKRREKTKQIKRKNKTQSEQEKAMLKWNIKAGWNNVEMCWKQRERMSKK